MLFSFLFDRVDLLARQTAAVYRHTRPEPCFRESYNYFGCGNHIGDGSVGTHSAFIIFFDPIAAAAVLAVKENGGDAENAVPVRVFEHIGNSRGTAEIPRILLVLIQCDFREMP